MVAALVVLFAADRFFRFQAVLPIMTPVLLIGGMTTGIFTPTEGAIAACLWAMVLGFAWYRTLNWKMFVKVCLDTVETTATLSGYAPKTTSRTTAPVGPGVPTWTAPVSGGTAPTISGTARVGLTLTANPGTRSEEHTSELQSH